ncbi:DgaE family pyridoxal phosphate-dependent ammonia lyase [Amycolatopsis taiwanensis]|uniref:DgaE family pyridoxal phosphate-dependent ammonia lyase n=1 Tax=Amycolatopsis taiwanensis TaxID=342230 RepID=UPI0004BAEACE|nr:DgaE family pyridoxal phosphate-dependent ammonia lyase [Amycolatopsis taiwanensis]
MNVYQKLGVRTAVNASGRMTALGGSTLAPEVAEAMADAGARHVPIEELFRAAGKALAESTGTEDACPVAGAAAGVATSVAAVIAGTDLDAVQRLPDAGGRPAEIVLQKGHCVDFGAPVTQMIRLGGGVPVEVGSVNSVSPAHLTAAIGDQTAAVLYVQSHHTVHKGMLSLAEVIELAHARGVPVILDAAAEEDLRRWPATGADLVVYSGGKAIGGPASGIVCGRADLVEAVHAQRTGIGRAMKIGKEVVVGLVSAVHAYASTDPEAPRRQEDRIRSMAAQLAELPGLDAKVITDEAGRDIHRARLTVLPEAGLSAGDLARELAAGTPPVYLREHNANLGQLAIDPRPLAPDEDEIVLRRIGEVLAAGPGSAGVIERTVVVTEPAGLHARPAAAFAQAAARSGVPITVAKGDGEPVDAKSVLSVMGLNVATGDRIVLRTNDTERGRAVIGELIAIVRPTDGGGG